MVNFGGKPIQAAPLAAVQNLLCIAVGSAELLWGLVLKYAVPLEWFDCLSKPHDSEVHGVEAESGVSIRSGGSGPLGVKGVRAKALSSLISKSSNQDQ